jgi:putative methionine-R-sulfoxide reductase with GAF domain
MTESVTAKEWTAAAASAKSNESQDEFVTKLAKIYQRLKYNKKLRAAMKDAEKDLLDLLDVRLFTIFQSVDNSKDILATFKGGDPKDDDSEEIRLPFNPTSLAGYVAASQRTLLIKDVRNRKELAEIHPKLNFENKYSEARGWKIKSQVIVPIKDEVLLGVLQLVNFGGDR